MKLRIKDHSHACELARLGLAAWKAQPESFPKVHQLLFPRPVLTQDQAKAHLSEIIPADKLETALADPWIDEMIAANASDFRNLISKNLRMPKLLVIDFKVFQGVSRSPEIFIKSIEKTLKL